MGTDCGESQCCAPKASADTSPRFRRALWIALAVNAGMFVVELSAGWFAGSVSLLADAVDFLGDAANYALSLLVISLAVVWRSRSALLKGVSMGAYGIFVLAQALWSWQQGTLPDASTMGWTGVAALIANVSVAWLLYAFREGDANMRSVWLCSRNDAIGNLAVLLAAAGVWRTGEGWPDIAVAVVMSALALSAARQVIQRSLQELRSLRAATTA